MKAVILAAGYGTRLQRDLEKEQSGQFQHLQGVAKPLLPVGDCALISHWLRALTQSACVDHVFVVTNALYYEAFQLWAQDFPSVHVLNDGTRNNEERLGAVACLQLAVNQFAVNDDDVIVIAGDTLFKEDFSLRKFTERVAEVQRKNKEGNLVLSYQCKDEETLKYGILEVDSDSRVTCMKEKPLPSETHSRSATRPLEERDAPGNFLSWLIERRPVYAHEISGRFDVGNLASYTECDRYFRETLQNPDLYLI
ncbi:Mannose-1-phosphate guanyltransferase beta [Bagarius yarrelli]|uniref:Mannose-1-phosphate guanyltransferase beta n=1 Tax=Bagarius yarrelli TaxID=175774 RepID=A0A556V6A8_BAGYA|nr:Mannose-1-phosphate guanyltransferase beta [Bagarius yarrelli]